MKIYNFKSNEDAFLGRHNKFQKQDSHPHNISGHSNSHGPSS